MPAATLSRCERCGSSLTYRDELGNHRCLCCGFAVWCGRDRDAERRERQQREVAEVTRDSRTRQLELWPEVA